jgi:hypothetical protein
MSAFRVKPEFTFATRAGVLGVLFRQPDVGTNRLDPSNALQCQSVMSDSIVEKYLVFSVSRRCTKTLTFGLLAISSLVFIKGDTS